MCENKPMFSARLGLRLLVATAAAAILTGCSDATRLSSNPFSNPFETASSGPVDRTPTGTIAPRSPSPSSVRIESKPLAPPTGASAQPAPSVAPQPVAAKPVPVQPLSRMSSSSIDHWSAEGGTPIVVAQGETVRALSDRYGVPQDALLRANGFNSSSQVQPGARLIVPVYRATAVRAATPAPAPVAKPAPAPVAKVEPRKAEAPKEKFRLVKGPDPVAKPAAKSAPKTAKVEKDDDEAPKAKAVEKKNTVEKKPEAKAKTAKAEPAKPAVKVEQPKPQRQKQAALEAAKPAPEVRAEPRKIETKPAEPRKAEVDRSETTASLPKEEPKAAPAGDSANPEFRWPARGRIIQGFKSGGNDGINIAVPEGTAVKAAEGGVVKYAGSELKGYGNLVLIQHPNGFVSAYAHNGELDVKRGDTVKRGQTIAKAGQTGNVSSPQVHFELRKGATPVDPTGYLAGL